MTITDDEIKAGIAERREREQNETLPSMNGRLQAEIPMRKDSPEFKELESKFNESFGDQIQIVGDRVEWRGNLIQDVASGKVERAHLGKASDGLISMMKGVVPKEDIEAFAKMNPTFNRNTFEQHAIKHFGENEKRLADNIPLLIGDYELMASAWHKPDRVIKVKDHHVVLELETFDGHYLNLAVNTMRGFSSFYKTKKPLEATSGNAPLSSEEASRRSGPADRGSIPHQRT